MEMNDCYDAWLLLALLVCLIGIFLVSKEILNTLKRVEREFKIATKNINKKLKAYHPKKRGNYNKVLESFSNTTYTNYFDLKDDYLNIINAYIRNEDYIYLKEGPEHYKLLIKTVYDIYLNKIDKLTDITIDKESVSIIYYDLDLINRSGISKHINNFETVFNKIIRITHKHYSRV